jgi:PAS domain S-box-containing protein
MPASHDHSLVALSVLISILGAYAAWALSARVRACHGWTKVGWLVGGAIADGTGTWSMHYTAKLALRLPVPVLFDWPTVVQSWLVGVVGSGAALLVLSRGDVRWGKVLLASVCMGGVGISGLHYTAMAAMRLPGMHHHYHSPALVTLSVVLAVLISVLALAVSFRLLVGPPGHPLRYHGSAVLRGMANPVMHYTAMAAVTFEFTNEAPDLTHAVPVEALGVLGISIVPVMVLVAALLTTLAGRLNRQRALLDELFEQAPQAVALLGADNRVVRVNREFTRVFGYTPDDASGHRLGELIVPDESRDEEKTYEDLVARGQRVDAEGVCRRKDGSRLDVSMVRVPVSIPGGQVETYAIYRDISERKQVERMVQDYVDRLQALSRRLLEVQEAERRHLARELHDEVGQMLTGLRMLLKSGGNLTADEVRTRFEQARTVVDDLLERVRGLSFDLRPAALDQLGLVPALVALFERYTNQTGVLVDFKHQGVDGRFSPELETAVYRVVQETLTNVARHAGVAGATVRVWGTPGTLNVQIEDRGRGFDPESALATPSSSGLAGMQERVRLLGGDLTIESRLGSGTQITAGFPLPDGPRGGNG